MTSRFTHRALIANCQRDQQHTRVALTGERRLFVRARAGGRAAVEVIDRATGVRCQQTIDVIAADASGRAQIVLQQPASTSKPFGLAYPCGRLSRTVNCQRSPACSLRGSPWQFAHSGPIPAQRDTWRNNGVWRQYSFNPKCKAHALLIRLRQFIDDADQLNVAAFPLVR